MSELDREALILNNLKLVHKMAHKYVHRVRDNAVDYDDLYGEGCLGLVKASQMFDPTRGEAKFSTYACSYIGGYILRHIRRKGYSVPHHVVDKASQIQRLGLHEVPIAELAKRFNCSKDSIEQALHFLEVRSVSMDYELESEKEGDTFANLMPHEEDFSTAIVNDFLSHITPQQAEVVRMRVFEGMEYQEMGDRIGTTKQGAGNRLSRAREKLVKYMAAAYAEA
ncbi:sigma-70 family RNA polymerase sigma factor [Paenibacillus silvisoli]|uniref:sigma-70 family RNA polymerase sigma factor n=1 Tax=Paenibacillus silvisoli TaxID=3110539 RepID=UPI0028046315|nr:sigma-70 family RNA polymerase sigma factor [Paenibacillus silvisoli]